MNRKIALVLIVVLSLGLVACGKNQSKPDKAPAEPAEAKAESLTDKGFEEKDGVLEYLELEESPIENGGLRIQVSKDEGKIHMIKTDAQGTDTTEYVTFYPEKNEVEKYKFVSMMGTGFYYTYDLEKGELVKIENDDREDTTESSKSAGRFDSANEDTKTEVEALKNYFENKFGSMEDAIK